MCCYREQWDEREYLVYTRKKHPFYGKQWFMTGKVDYGETIAQTAQRELKEETNLEWTPELAMIEHYLVYDKNTQELLEDKYLYLCIFKNPTGKLIPCDEWDYERVKKSNLKTYIQHPFYSKEKLFWMLEMIENRNGQLSFYELRQFTDEF